MPDAARRDALTRLRWPLLAVMTLLSSTPTLGCENSCADLQVICDDCVDPNQRSRCEETVDTQDEDSCVRDLDSYQDICQ